MSVTTHLMGGMGNQMFQYATGLALARRLGTDLRLDVSSFSNDGMRRYSLGLWHGVTAPKVTSMNGTVVREQGMPYNPGLFEHVPRECSLYGYWQCERYFVELEAELQERFTPGTPLPTFHQEMLRQIKDAGSRSAFLTIRRTDYVGNSFHGELPHDYYLKAAELVAARVSDPIFFVFSDDPGWVLENFRLPYRTVVAGNYDRTVRDHLGREDAELYLMSQCQHAVMANSSYSWWGAWLNPDRDRVVVAPKAWFGPTGTEDPRDIVPNRWLRI